MAIANSAELTFQPFQFPPINGMPRGLFGVTVNTVGDVSGGNKVTTLLKTSGVPHDLIYQFDSVIVSNDSATLDFFVVEIVEGGLYSANLTVRGSFFDDQSQPIRELAGYIMYPVKGITDVLIFTTDNDDGDITAISLRGRYWERSYLRGRGETPKFL